MTAPGGGGAGRWRRALAALAAAGVAGSCQGSSLPASPEVVAVTMEDYRFTVPEAVPSGRVVFRARNAGRLDHELVLVVLPEDFPITIDAQLNSDKRTAFPTRAYLPSRPPGASGTFATDLGRGRYAVICFVRDADGKEHARKGMSAEFRVR